MNLQTEVVPQHKSRLLLKNPVMMATGIFGYCRDDAPIELSQEGAAALDDCIILHEQAQGALVKRPRFWYDSHGQKLLAGSCGHICVYYACKLSFCQETILNTAYLVKISYDPPTRG